MGPAPRSARVPFSARGTSGARSISVGPPNAKCDTQGRFCSIAIRFIGDQKRTFLNFVLRLRQSDLLLLSFARIVKEQKSFLQIDSGRAFAQRYFEITNDSWIIWRRVKICRDRECKILYCTSIWNERLHQPEMRDYVSMKCWTNENVRCKIFICFALHSRRIIWRSDYLALKNWSEGEPRWWFQILSFLSSSTEGRRKAPLHATHLAMQDHEKPHGTSRTSANRP